MTHGCVFCAGKTPALQYARQFLAEAGIPVTDVPRWDTRHLLLDVPSFRPGLWEEQELDTLLTSLPPDITVWGGHLNHPAWNDFQKNDLLLDEAYLLENARITAECTIPIARAHLKKSWPESAALVIGWGRIGKALAFLLRERGCPVTVASGSSEKRKEIQTAGFSPADTGRLTGLLPGFHLIVNTAPAAVLSETECALCCDAVKIDLASRKGISGADVLWERGLPGRFAPKQSGRLIADTFLKYYQEVEQ